MHLKDTILVCLPMGKRGQESHIQLSGMERISVLFPWSVKRCSRE